MLRTNFIASGSMEGIECFRKADYNGSIQHLPWLGTNPIVYSKNSPKHELRTKLKLSGTVIGFVGRLLQMKGVATLLDAAAKLHGQYTLVLAGEGEDKDLFAAQAQQLGISDNVRFAGSIPNENVVDYLRCMDMLVLPSRTTVMWKEQFGRVLTEAMACEVPVIGSSSGEIPYVISDAGLIFPEGDPDALAKAIQSLTNDPDRRQALGAAGRTRVLENFTNEAVARKYHEVYNELTAKANE